MIWRHMPRMENGSRSAFDLAVAAVHLFSVALRAFVQTGWVFPLKALQTAHLPVLEEFSLFFWLWQSRLEDHHLHIAFFVTCVKVFRDFSIIRAMFDVITMPTESGTQCSARLSDALRIEETSQERGGRLREIRSKSYHRALEILACPLYHLVAAYIKRTEKTWQFLSPHAQRKEPSVSSSV